MRGAPGEPTFDPSDPSTHQHHRVRAVDLHENLHDQRVENLFVLQRLVQDPIRLTVDYERADFERLEAIAERRGVSGLVTHPRGREGVCGASEEGLVAAKVVWYRGTWWLRVHHRGQKKDRKIGATKVDKRKAEKLAEQVNASIALGTLGVKSKAKELPFDTFAAEWLRTEVFLPRETGRESALAKSTALLREQHVRLHLKPFFQRTPIAEIRVRDVQRLHTHLTERGRLSQRSIDLALGTLRRILAHAHLQELIPSNPVDTWRSGRGRTTAKAGQPLDRRAVLSREEVNSLLEAARRPDPESSWLRSYYPLVLFLADTGCRIGKALALRWSDVDLRAGTALIERSVDHLGRVGPTKTRRSRWIELSSRLRGVLSEARPQVYGDASFVFPGRDGGVLLSGNFRRRAFRKLVKLALDREVGVTPHSLRHTWASLHMANGTPLKWIQEQGGWASAKMLLDVYGHFLPGENRGFANVVSGEDDVSKRLYTSPTQEPDQKAQMRVGPKSPILKDNRWSRRPDSNRRPANYESAALPAELRRLGQKSPRQTGT